MDEQDIRENCYEDKGFQKVGLQLHTLRTYVFSFALPIEKMLWHYPQRTCHLLFT